MRASLFLSLLVASACTPGASGDLPLVEDQVALRWSVGQTFHLATTYRVANVKGENIPNPLATGTAEPTTGAWWTDEAVWTYQVVETEVVPEEGDELYPYSLDATGTARPLDVVRAWLDGQANADQDLLDADPVVYMIFRADRDRLAALVAFVDEDGERTEYAYDSRDLDKASGALSQSMLTDAPTYLAPFTARFDDDTTRLEDGSTLTSELGADGDTVDVTYAEAFGGSVTSTYELDTPWPTYTVAPNVEARLLTAGELEGFRRTRHPASYLRQDSEVPDDFDYKAALQATIDLDASFVLDEETLAGGWDVDVYDEVTPWPGSWWPLSKSNLVFGYDDRDTFSDRIHDDVKENNSRRDEIQEALRELDKSTEEGQASYDELIAEYRTLTDEVVEILVGFYDGIRDDLDGGQLRVEEGELVHDDGWSYTIDELSPFDKFALLEHLRDADINNPFYLPAWELLNQYNPVGGSWWGKCNGWAAAAILTDEPLEDLTVTEDGVEVTLTTADQKGLLASSFYSGASSFYGGRYNGEDDDVADLHPKAFHAIVDFYIRQQRVPFVFDTTATEAVWNYPVQGAAITVTETTADTGEPKLDLNTATLDELAALEVLSDDQALDLMIHRLYVAPIQSFDAIPEIDGLSTVDLEALGEVATVDPQTRTFELEATITLETDAVAETWLSTMGSTTFDKVWGYTLTTDADGRVLDLGTWDDPEEHPDFAWVPYHNPRTRAQGGSENPFLEYAALLDVLGEDIER